MPENIAPVGGLTPTLRERIERGAAWLDTVQPDWRCRIDLDTLDVASGYTCVLGQVFNYVVEEPVFYSGFDYAVDNIVPVPRPVAPWLAAHGFDVHPSVDTLSYCFDYEPLTVAWADYLQEG